MCLNPTYLTVKSKYIDLSVIGTVLQQEVPCGKCAECKQIMQNEYYVRSHSMYMDTLDKGGFTFWDTLTYSQENVPWFDFSFDFSLNEFRKLQGLDCFSPIHRGFEGYVNNISSGRTSMLCFDFNDYSKFLKRLRTNLCRAGYDVKDNLKYFVTSEYGGETHRPHYHIVFYVTIPNMTPEIFNIFVQDAWQMGITDISKSAYEKTVNGFGAINYIAKYVTKDDEFTKVLKLNLKHYLSNVPKDLYKPYIKNILPFHRQSRGYGECIIKRNDYEYMFNNDKVRFADQSGYHSVNIPMYIKRKLWYECRKNSDGRLQWILNDEGRKHYKKNSVNMINKVSENYQRAYDMASDIVPDEKYTFDIKSEIDRCLGNRTFKDLAKYAIYYRGRSIDGNYVPSLDEMIDARFEREVYDIGFLLDYAEKRDIPIDKSNIYVRDDDNNNIYRSLDGKRVDINDIVLSHSIDQNTSMEFQHFDYILGLLRCVTDIKSMNLQSEYDEKVRIKNRLKRLKKKYNF